MKRRNFLYLLLGLIGIRPKPELKATGYEASIDFEQYDPDFSRRIVITYIYDGRVIGQTIHHGL